MQKTLTCIQCPNGCRLTAVQHGDGSVTVTGNLCRRGEEFGTAELVCPKRSVTTTVRTAVAELPWLPVRTDGEVNKADVPAVIVAARAACVAGRPDVGEPVLKNVAGTGVDLIATVSLKY